MNLDVREKRNLLYCCAEELKERRNGKPPGPQPWLARLIRRLELEVATAECDVSRVRQDPESSQSALDAWIGSPEAAAILGWSKRQVQRHAADLDGQIKNGRWWFPRAAVLEYAEARSVSA